MLDELDALEAIATNGATDPTGMLRIVAHTTVTVGRLVPLIASFRRRYPLVGLDITLTERPVDLVADGFDVAIVLPFMLTTDTAVTRLLERMPVILVASPGYLACHPPAEHPLTLAGHQFVAMHASIRKPELTFLVDGKELVVPVRTDVTSNNVVLNRELVLEGFGMGILPAAIVRDELKSGRLVTVLNGFPVLGGSVEMRVAYSSRTLLPAKVRAFVEHASSFFEDGNGAS